jgi:predicted ATP-dependent serine protease
MIEHVKMRRLTSREAAKIMGKCCECAVFNTVRAEHLLEKMLET